VYLVIYKGSHTAVGFRCCSRFSVRPFNQALAFALIESLSTNFRSESTRVNNSLFQQPQLQPHIASDQHCSSSSAIARRNQYDITMASTIPPPNEILWCKDPIRVAAWLARNNLGLEFYGSFLNYCARSIDKLKNVNGRLIKDHLDRLRVTLTQEPLDDTAVLQEMKFYYKRLYKTGLVKTGAYPLDELRKYYLLLLSLHKYDSTPIPPLRWRLSCSYQKTQSDREWYGSPVRSAVSHALTGHEQPSISYVHFDGCMPESLETWELTHQALPSGSHLLQPSISFLYSNQIQCS
jgi:hypothetical protein